MERKGLHVLNTVIIGIILFFVTITLLGTFLFSVSSGNSSTYFKTGGGIWMIVFTFIVSAIYFIFMLSSFKKCKLDNKFFKWADSLNVIAFFGSIIFSIFLGVFLSAMVASTGLGGINLIDKANSYMNVLSWIGGIIYVGSFVVFLIGYYRNKK